MSGPALKILRRSGSLLSTLALALALLLLAAMLAGMLLKVKPLVVYSDSMRPSFQAGDIVLSKQVPAQALAIGDVVTFSDPNRDGQLITHRLISARPQEQQLAMTTLGDANSGGERWLVPPQGLVGRTELVVPKLGYLLTWMQNAGLRVLVLVAVMLAILVKALRMIWRPAASPQAEGETGETKPTFQPSPRSEA